MSRPRSHERRPPHPQASSTVIADRRGEKIVYHDAAQTFFEALWARAHPQALSHRTLRTGSLILADRRHVVFDRLLLRS